ncbi:MAG: helix-turn-helix transcriptional regulator [Clostridia bacterium]|nr:helix-turn-helix transcriptional regulator [Clostridia bacterium]
MEDIYKTWGNIIKDKRKELGYTQEMLADIASVSNVYISKLERGQVNPSCRILEKLCNGLGIDINYLFFKDYQKDYTA